MHRLVALGALLVVVAIAHRVLADLENQQRGGEGGLFTSRADHLQLVVPRTWHASDQPSYPGFLLWLEHGEPGAHIVLTADPFTHQLYCSWQWQLIHNQQRASDIGCRASDSLPMKFACALRIKLKSEHMHVGPILAGPKENELAGMETVLFEYDDGKHFLRQAVAVTEDRAVSLLLSTTSYERRIAYTRAFEQALRTLAPWNEEATTPFDAGTALGPPGDAGVANANVLVDAAVGSAAPAALMSAPASKIHPVGSCAQQ
jgi:hypothetical protein